LEREGEREGRDTSVGSKGEMENSEVEDERERRESRRGGEERRR